MDVYQGAEEMRLVRLLRKLFITCSLEKTDPDGTLADWDFPTLRSKQVLAEPQKASAIRGTTLGKHDDWSWCLLA